MCNAPHDTIGHRLGACTHPSIKKQVCARHGHAVNAIVEEIKAGSLANCAMLSHAECHQRYTSLPRSFLPLRLQTSRPDIVLLENFTKPLSSFRAGNRRDSHIALHLVEVTFTSDLGLRSAMAKKADQHRQLCTNLLNFGWVNVNLHCFVIGHTGSMLTLNARILARLGISSHRIPAFLSEQAIDGLRKSAAILACFPKYDAGESHSPEPRSDTPDHSMPATPRSPHADAPQPPLLAVPDNVALNPPFLPVQAASSDLAALSLPVEVASPAFAALSLPVQAASPASATLSLPVQAASPAPGPMHLPETSASSASPAPCRPMPAPSPASQTLSMRPSLQLANLHSPTMLHSRAAPSLTAAHARRRSRPSQDSPPQPPAAKRPRHMRPRAAHASRPVTTTQPATMPLPAAVPPVMPPREQPQLPPAPAADVALPRLTFDPGG